MPEGKKYQVKSNYVNILNFCDGVGLRVRGWNW